MEAQKTWYELYPELYKAEIEVLEKGLDFFQLAKVLPLSHSRKVTVYGTLQHKQGGQYVKIEFPFGYPFDSVAVTPIQKITDQNGKEFGEVPAQFNKGRQYNDGMMCLYDKDDSWIPFVNGVVTALKQAVVWLDYAKSKEGFPKELTVDENLPLIGNPIGQVLYYDNGIELTGNSGIMLLKSFKPNFYSLLQIQFEENDGLRGFKAFEDNTPLSPSEKETLIGHWYLVKGKSAKDFIQQMIYPELLKQFLFENGYLSIDELTKDSTSTQKTKVISFYFETDRSLHFLQITYWKEGGSTNFNQRYLLPKRLNTELFARVESMFSIDSLSKKKILAIGCGAIGSEVLVELGANGIGNFSVIDGEPFDCGNSSRHRGDLRHVGDQKVSLTKELIQAKNPKAKVNILPASIFDIPVDLLVDLIKGSDLILDFTASDRVAEYLNELAYNQSEKTVLQAAVSKGGATGVVVLMIPKRSLCYKCLQQQGLDSPPTPFRRLDRLPETSPELGQCSKPAMPGSSIDTREVAIQAARVSLQFLFEGDSVYPELLGYQFYWHGPSGSLNSDGTKSNKKPFEWEILNLSCECSPIETVNGKSSQTIT